MNEVCVVCTALAEVTSGGTSRFATRGSFLQRQARTDLRVPVIRQSLWHHVPPLLCRPGGVSKLCPGNNKHWGIEFVLVSPVSSDGEDNDTDTYSADATKKVNSSQISTSTAPPAPKVRACRIFKSKVGFKKLGIPASIFPMVQTLWGTILFVYICMWRDYALPGPAISSYCSKLHCVWRFM